MKTILVSYLSLILITIGCSHSNPKYQTLNQSLTDDPITPDATVKENIYPAVDEHLVVPGFSFRLNHPNDKDLAGTYRVGFDGILHLPYKINIDTKNHTVQEVTEKVTQSYRSFFKPGSPNVTFNLIERKYWVEIGGLVNKSGKYLVNANTTFDELAAMAGGLTTEAKTEYMTAKITQGQTVIEVDLNQYYKSGDLSRFPPWHGGDIVFVKKLGGLSSLAPQMIKVLGDVRSPNDIPYIEGADLYYYVLKAGGQNNTVDMEKYEIVRTIDGVKKSIVFNPTKVETIPKLLAGDVLTLYPYHETMTERVLRAVSYVGTVITAVALLVIAF
ncbi:MAG: polysaccharide biosynthesis/export family protein [Bacteriovoracaceae bacterium]